MAKILAIDDEERMLELISAFLENDDHEIQTATRGRDAIEKAKHFNPDLILCDVQMPDMDGYDVLKEFRSDDAFLGLPFIFLTGLDDMKHLRQGMNLGADDYLTKPFSYADLSQAVKVRLEKHRAVTESYEAEVRQAEERAETALYTDEVTGLANQKALSEQFLSRLQALGEMAVMVCGFDQFDKLIEERPAALANVILKGAATRLRSAFDSEDNLYSIGRNRFVLLMPCGDAFPSLAQRAQMVLSKLNDPYKIMGQELTLGVSLGIARVPDDGEELNGLLRKAEAACVKAEAAGGNQHHFAE